MGEVISRKASRDRIIDDVSTTRTRAATRATASTADASAWAVAESRLGPVLTLWSNTLAKAEAAKAEVAPVEAALDVANDTSDDVIKGISDTVWNELGRPANDPVFELLFPGGTGSYAEVEVEDQPSMMLLLAELLETNPHPKIAPTVAPKVAALREAALKLEAAVDAARKPRSKAKLYDRMLTAVARSAHFELAKLKRYWKSEGLSEADIHAVIPDRPRSYGVGPNPGPSPADPANPPDPTA